MAKNVSAEIHLQYCNALDLRCYVLTPMCKIDETFKFKSSPYHQLHLTCLVLWFLSGYTQRLKFKCDIWGWTFIFELHSQLDLYSELNLTLGVSMWRSIQGRTRLLEGLEGAQISQVSSLILEVTERMMTIWLQNPTEENRHHRVDFRQIYYNICKQQSLILSMAYLTSDWSRASNHTIRKRSVFTF